MTTEPKPKAARPPRPRIPSTTAARRLKVRLEALAAAPGTPEEGEAARVKLGRLLARVDFSVNREDVEGIFTGHFQKSNDARPVCICTDPSLANQIKWALEESTGIPCLFRGQELFAQATPATAEQFKRIARTISEGFTRLWESFSTFPTVTHLDRGLFFNGLFDGMTNQPRKEGQMLPPRATIKGRGRKTKAAVGHAAGIGIHPYSIALELGAQLRFRVPVQEVTNQLENKRPKQLGAA